MIVVLIVLICMFVWCAVKEDDDDFGIAHEDKKIKATVRLIFLLRSLDIKSSHRGVSNFDIARYVHRSKKERLR